MKSKNSMYVTNYLLKLNRVFCIIYFTMDRILTSVYDVSLLCQVSFMDDEWSPRINNNCVDAMSLCKQSESSDDIDLNLQFAHKFPSYLKSSMISTNHVSITLLFPGGNGIMFAAEIDNSVIKNARDNKDTVIPFSLHYSFEDIDPISAKLVLMSTKHDVYVKTIHANIPHNLLKKGIEVILHRRACANNQVRFDGKCTCMSKNCLICNK
jgi:hypothetical protein